MAKIDLGKEITAHPGCGTESPWELRQTCAGVILFLRFLARERKESGKEKQKKEERPSWRAGRLRRSIL